MTNTNPSIALLYRYAAKPTQTQQAHPDNLAEDRPADPRASQLTLGPVSASKLRPTLARLRDVLTDLRVHGICRLVAFELLTYWEPGGTVFPSVTRLAEGIGVDPRIVRRHVARLERIGLWVRVGRPGHSNRYDFRLPGDEDKSKCPLLTPDPTIPPPGSYDPPEVTKEVTSTKRRARRNLRELRKTTGPLDTGRTAINADRPGSQTPPERATTPDTTPSCLRARPQLPGVPYARAGARRHVPALRLDAGGMGRAGRRAADCDGEPSDGGR